MKTRIYPLRLFKPDQEARKLIVAHHSREAGRQVDFATILRKLIADEQTRIFKHYNVKR